jgi:hypothetical protein
VIAFLSLAILVIILFLRARSQHEMNVENNSEEHSGGGELSSTVNFTGLDDDDAVSFVRQEAPDGSGIRGSDE